MPPRAAGISGCAKCARQAPTPRDRRQRNGGTGVAEKAPVPHRGAGRWDTIGAVWRDTPATQTLGNDQRPKTTDPQAPTSSRLGRPERLARHPARTCRQCGWLEGATRRIGPTRHSDCLRTGAARPRRPMSSANRFDRRPAAPNVRPRRAGSKGNANRQAPRMPRKPPQRAPAPRLTRPDGGRISPRNGGPRCSSRPNPHRTPPP